MPRSFPARRAPRLALAALPIALLAGCVQQNTNGNETTFRYEYWVPVSAFLGGVAATPIGWALRQRSARLGWGLLIFGPILALGIAPSLFADKIVVNADYFQVQSGFWGMSSAKQVRYDDMQSLRITSEVSTGRRGRKKTNYFFVCQLKSGPEVKIPMDNKIHEAAVIPILTQVAAHKVAISNEADAAE